MVDRVDINNVLADIRALRAQMQQTQRIRPDMGTQPSDVVRPTAEVPSFGTVLKGAVDKVNELQQTSNQLATRYEQGDPSVDISRVMIASQKSSVAFQAMTQVRNRLVQSYEDIMKMPI